MLKSFRNIIWVCLNNYLTLQHEKGDTRHQVAAVHQASLCN